jgi:hypothetical protein
MQETRFSCMICIFQKYKKTLSSIDYMSVMRKRKRKRIDDICKDFFSLVGNISYPIGHLGGRRKREILSTFYQQ